MANFFVTCDLRCGLELASKVVDFYYDLDSEFKGQELSWDSIVSDSGSKEAREGAVKTRAKLEKLFAKYNIEFDCCKSTMMRTRTIEPLSLAKTFALAKSTDG